VLWRKERLGELSAADAELLVAAFEADYFGTGDEEPAFAAVPRSDPPSWTRRPRSPEAMGYVPMARSNSRVPWQPVGQTRAAPDSPASTTSCARPLRGADLLLSRRSRTACGLSDRCPRHGEGGAQRSLPRGSGRKAKRCCAAAGDPSGESLARAFLAHASRDSAWGLRHRYGWHPQEAWAGQAGRGILERESYGWDADEGGR
jgi:hypothetical protein